ncbi:nSTAND1 domain-containing NTPase [Shewanella sp.]|uniref:nSTAND1 domain-containing NTPase n=1 Tax=Shewanella sp. TaxID=50422 RepID=UPI004054513B
MDNPFPLASKVYQLALSQWQSWFSAAPEETSEQAIKLSLKDVANKTRQLQTRKQCDLPLSFPVAELPHFIGRTEALNQLEAALELWRESQGELTCIVAPFGSGLSSLLNAFRTSHQNQSTTSITFVSFYQAPLSAKEAIAHLYACFHIKQAPSSITQAIKLINQQIPQVLLIDNMHKLMVRIMGNYQALVTFATILMETRAKHCWIFGCESFAWQRLTSQYQINNFIKTIIKLDYFSVDEMEQMLTQKFADLELSNDQEAPRLTQQICKQLHSISLGHPKLASLLLLDAIAQDDQQKNDLIELREIDIGTLKTCSDEDLFTLAEVYVHAGLSVKQHADIFASSIERSSLKLEYLSRQGLLLPQYVQHDFAAHRYEVPTCLTKIVANHLVNNNKLFK